MTRQINLNYTRRPSPFLSVIKAAAGFSRKFPEGSTIPSINAQWKSVKINKKHLDDFLNICGLTDGETIPFLYPYSLIYPIIMRILTHREAPLSLFNSLNVRTKTIQYRPIYKHDIMDINSYINGWRLVEKGLEVDVTTGIRSCNENVWENTSTFFYRGKFGEPDTSFASLKMESIPDAPALARWFLPEGIGYRFSRIIGDNNGIHYGAWYARLFGFKRDFAQPVLVLGNSIGLLPDIEQDKPVQLDVLLKGPVYYNNTVFIKGIRDKNRQRFDIYCGNESRPGILCDLKILK